MPAFSTCNVFVAAIAPLLTLMATLGPAPAHSRLLLQYSELTVAPAGTVLECGDFGSGNERNENRVCDNGTSIRCNYRTCSDDDTLIEKCIVPDRWRPSEESLPEGAECEILTTEGDGTPQELGSADGSGSASGAHGLGGGSIAKLAACAAVAAGVVM